MIRSFRHPGRVHLWLGLQAQYDLWRAQQGQQPTIEPLRRVAA